MGLKVCLRATLSRQRLRFHVPFGSQKDSLSRRFEPGPSRTDFQIIVDVVPIVNPELPSNGNRRGRNLYVSYSTKLRKTELRIDATISMIY